MAFLEKSSNSFSQVTMLPFFMCVSQPKEIDSLVWKVNYTLKIKQTQTGGKNTTHKKRKTFFKSQKLCILLCLDLKYGTI